MRPIAVRAWDDKVAATNHDLHVIAVETPDTQDRRVAREMVRAAVAEFLATRLGCGIQDIALTSSPGQPLRVQLANATIGLSISHEPGLSLAAVHFGGRVGIDLLRVSTASDWLADVPRLAQDYLGPDAAGELKLLPANERANHFAESWTRLEAGLKCLEIGLTEWTPALQRELDKLEYVRLDLPIGYVGTVAVPITS